MTRTASSHPAAARAGCTLLFALALAACNGEAAGPETGVAAELVGEWIAEPACAPPAGPCSFTLTWAEQPQVRLDAILALGVSVRLDITAGGQFTRSGTGSTESGTVRTEDGLMITRSSAGVTDTIDYRVQGSTLTLEFRRLSYDVDFDADGTKDGARVSGVFRRRGPP